MSNSHPIVWLALAASACTSADFADGQFRCDPADPSGCPTGMICTPDGTCRHGSGPSSSGSGGAGGTGGTAGGTAGGLSLGGAGGSTSCPTLDIGGSATISFGERVVNGNGADVSGVTADTFVTEKTGQDADNFGASGDMWADGYPTATALLRFELCSVPAGTKVVHAWLDVYVCLPNGDPNRDCGGPEAAVYEVLEGWAEGDMDGGVGVANYGYRLEGETWTKAGARGGSLAPTAMCPLSDLVEGQELPCELDASVVQRWIDDPDHNNFGVALTTLNTTLQSGVGFITSNATGKSADSTALEPRRPQLTLELTGGG